MKSDEQIPWYHSGIGTYARPSNRSLAYWMRAVFNKIDLAVAMWASIALEFASNSDPVKQKS
jgi:hypothetical protein